MWRSGGVDRVSRDLGYLRMPLVAPCPAVCRLPHSPDSPNHLPHHRLDVGLPSPHFARASYCRHSGGPRVAVAATSW
ncbi:hypothetical protein KSP40_PGU010302 [Platanthera guangdongensis]|uniref:Uncharacterized protein n=1 Tax=Platanthera guangdongensis TaxID=2320717 RepID=A0ABR2MR44_9ASPA